MIKIRLVPLLLIISTASLVVFFGFGMALTEVSEEYSQRVEEVKQNSNQALKRLDMAHRQVIDAEKRADSLQIIVEAAQRKEILWMARAMYSETKRPHEMWYVGWVIRNRYEARYRGQSYKDVILHPKQFSAFNRDYPLRDRYLQLEPHHVDQMPRWYEALATAKRVIDAPDDFRPFPKDTYHFYSRRAMSNDPYWENSLTRVDVSAVESRRFAFLRGTGSESTSTVATAR